MSVAGGEWLWLALVRTAAVEEQRLVLIVLLQQRGVLKARDHGTLTLNARKGNCAYLLRVERLPALPVELHHEGRNEFGVQKVDEAVTHVAAVLEVNGKVEEVICALMVHIHLFQQHLLIVLVGNIPDLNNEQWIES